MSTEAPERYFCPECGVACVEMSPQQIHDAPQHPMLYGMRYIERGWFAVHPIPTPLLPCKGAVPQLGKVDS